MKYEDLKYSLKAYGYKPTGRENGDVIAMDNGIVQVIFHRMPGYNSSGNAYRLVCCIPGKKVEVLATSNWDIYSMHPDCYFGTMEKVVNVLTGDPTKIVKTFKDLYMNSLLDEVLG